MKTLLVSALPMWACLLLAAVALTGLPASGGKKPAVPGEPFNPVEFRQMRVTDTWARYAGKLTWGKGQTLAVLDDGCDVTVPEWTTALPWGAPKVAAAYDSVDQDDDPSLVPPGYHGTGTGFPSSVRYQGRLGVAFNDQVIHVRCATIVHLPSYQSGMDSIARGLQWVIDHRKQYNITTVNLAPVDDVERAEPIPTVIDDKLKRLRELGVWVSAPCGNSGFTKGINWPACQPGCFSIGAVKVGEDVAHLNRFSNTDLLAPAGATTSSNAHAVGCAMVLREAIQKSGYKWKNDGKTIPDAMMAIFRKTGILVHDPKTKLEFRRLDLVAAVDYVFVRGE